MASSTETAQFPAANAVDGSTTTRWASLFSDPQWIYVDLGSTATVTRVVLNWEAAFGRAYQIQVSNDASAWTTVYSTTTGAGGINDVAVSGSGRYVRMNGTQRGTAWGYSLWEFQVYGTTGGGGQAPYLGTARAIPGTIQAEHYDTGGEGVAYHDTTAGNTGGQLRTDGVDIQATTDTGGGQNVGWTAAGEWLEYTVNVGTGGAYTLEARAASESTGGTLHVEMDGANVSGTVTVPSTGGWQNWTTVSKAVTLSAGSHVMRLALDSGGYNLNWLRFTSGTTGNCTTLPSVPTGLGSPSKTSSTVSLAWSASTPGANCTVSYRVFQNGAQVTQVSTTSATVSGLAANTTYSFSVAAVNQFGSSAQSGALSVTTSAATKNMEVMTWVPSYSQSTWKAALQANTGGANNPRNTLTR
ncbi:MAG TPA: carbohydrate-binding protein, partial [Vicinamibacteria bacterium]